MIQASPQHRAPNAGEIVVLPRVADIAGHVLLSGLGHPSIGYGDLANVVPFRRPKTAQSDAPPCAVDPATRPIPPVPASRGRRFSLAIAATVLMHGAAFAAFFYYEPPPFASIGIEAISVEIVVGSNTPAGDTDPQSKSSVNSTAAPPEEKVADKPTPDETQAAPEKPAEFAAVEPAQTAVEPPPRESTSAEVALAPDMPLTTPEPSKPVESKPVESRPVQIKHDVPKAVAKKPVETRRNAAAKKKSDDAQKKTQVASAPPAADPSVASKGAGVGRSDARSNYAGIVRAHLMRYLQSIGEPSPGPAIVEFTVSSSGGLVSSRLVSPSGNPRLDELALSMVRRASPYPAPGPGDPRTSRVPIATRR